MANIYFLPKDRGSWLDREMVCMFHCQFCNEHLDVTQLVHELLKYDMKTCPSMLYLSFKILRLGSMEYASHNPDKEHRILKAALEELKEGQVK